MTTLVFENK